MKNALQLLFLSLFIANASLLEGQVIWNGPNITVSKAAFADPSQASNQDRITDEVWITRGNTQGLFNAKVENSYDTSSPSGTEWAKGTTADIESLSFTTWKAAVDNMPPNNLNQNLVLHLIAEDIYIDIRFTQWGQGAGGGGSFTYIRSTEAPSNTNEVNLDNSITIFPNPASDFIEVSGPVEGDQFDIYDLASGRKMLSGLLNRNLRIEIGELPAGNYILQTKERQTTRFVKVNN